MQFVTPYQRLRMSKDRLIYLVGLAAIWAPGSNEPLEKNAEDLVLLGDVAMEHLARLDVFGELLPVGENARFLLSLPAFEQIDDADVDTRQCLSCKGLERHQVEAAGQL